MNQCLSKHACDILYIYLYVLLQLEMKGILYKVKIGLSSSAAF